MTNVTSQLSPRRMLPIIGIGMILAGCGESLPATAPPSSTNSAGPFEASPIVSLSDAAISDSAPVLELVRVRGRLFSTAGECIFCHSNYELGDRWVSYENSWRPTMKANSSRDPYWRAAVRREASLSPASAATIEAHCSRCHTPMATVEAEATGGEVRLFGEGFLSSRNKLHALAIDGISCALCHQVRPDKLGTPATWSGHFRVDMNTTQRPRTVYGSNLALPMAREFMVKVSGFQPVVSSHIKDPGLCGSCHVLFTEPVGGGGREHGAFAEQMAFLEWKASSVAAQRTCQECHMPARANSVWHNAAIMERIKRTFHDHTFRGANVTMLRILELFREKLEVVASTEEINRQIGSSIEMLQQQAGRVALENVEHGGGRVRARVRVTVTTGHKFPTGFPSRRAWLRFTITDPNGRVLFRSGGFSRAGRIEGNDNDADPARFEPHYRRITSADQVQIYEPILRAVDGRVTTSVTLAASYAKDNRLLPAGFKPVTMPEAISPKGEAAADTDFTGGGDEIDFDVPAEAGPGASVKVELLYQSIGYRWAENLRSSSNLPEVSDFLDMLDPAGNRPVQVAVAEARID